MSNARKQARYRQRNKAKQAVLAERLRTWANMMLLAAEIDPACAETWQEAAREMEHHAKEMENRA
jgi:hypothetical protein